MVNKRNLAFVGAGNMASSIIGGLIATGTPADDISVYDPNAVQLKRIASTYQVHAAESNASASKSATTIVLAVKPDVVQNVCREIASAISHNPLIVSIAAGVRVKDILRWLSADTAIVRCMPNTPALLNLGANALFANEHCNAQHRDLAQALIGATGITQWVDNEDQIDTVTALSGSGPAYFFLLNECMTQAAVDMGLSAEVAQNLAIETAYGAASMARAQENTPAQLRDNVTSKGGTTAAALSTFKQSGFANAVANAMTAARDRATALGDELSVDQVQN